MSDETIINLAPASTPFPILVVAFLVSLWIGVAAHEMGHFLVGKAVRFPTRLVQIGEGKLVCRVSLLGTPVEFRLLPLAGAVRFYPMMRTRKYAQLIVTAAGLLANFLMIALLGIWQKSSGPEDLSPGFWTAAFFGQCLPLLNLLPIPMKVQNQQIGSDGLRFIKTIFLKNGALTEFGKNYLFCLQEYTQDIGKHPLVSDHSSRIMQLRIIASYHDETLVITIVKEMEKLILTGSLTPPEECLVLDYFLTFALLSRNDKMFAQIDGWSQRLIELAPQSERAWATRGGVLTEIGRYEEAKAIMIPLLLKDQDLFNATVTRFFLGVAEFRLGNVPNAIRCCWEIRTRITEAQMLPTFRTRLTELEEKLSTALSAQQPTPELVTQ